MHYIKTLHYYYYEQGGQWWVLQVWYPLLTSFVDFGKSLYYDCQVCWLRLSVHFHTGWVNTFYNKKVKGVLTGWAPLGSTPASQLTVISSTILTQSVRSDIPIVLAQMSNVTTICRHSGGGCLFINTEFSSTWNEKTNLATTVQWSSAFIETRLLNFDLLEDNLLKYWIQYSNSNYICQIFTG
jgi:hypothetical protein